ncbi:hypothetical protein F4604DRAFT_1687616 [Suillus subluteus]|nr:hypothetical protein F4604DRAFT_1687616 [Suillus subluteus]
MTTSGNGCQGSNHICITSWIEKLRQKTGDASSANRMGSTNVKIVLASPSIARAVAGVNIITILFTGSVNGMDNSLSRVVLAQAGTRHTPSAMMANNVRPSQIGGICSKETNTEDQLEPEDLPFVLGPEFQPKENTMVIIDKSGVHRLEIRCCELSQCVEPKTAFTFRVLDDFLLDNLECGTSAMNYYSKLRRMTSSMFPHLVPVILCLLHQPGHDIDKACCKDRYRELMRVARQWRQLKTMKWHGFGHRSDIPSTGELALFCPACPQPGINVLVAGDESLDDDDKNSPSWKYTRSFVMDGNFKAEHLHPIKPLMKFGCPMVLDSWWERTGIKCIWQRLLTWWKNRAATTTGRSIKLMLLGTSWSPPVLGELPVPDTVALSLTPWLIFKKAKGE